jgi:hypothetical protein
MVMRSRLLGRGLSVLAIASVTAVVALTAGGCGGSVRGTGRPNEKLTAADQAHAKALLLRKIDIGGPVEVERQSLKDDPHYCKATDQSDLTITGKAESKLFSAHGIDDIASSSARIYSTAADAAAGWQRATASAGLECAAASARRGLQKSGFEFISLHKVPFPAVAPQTTAFRLTFRETKEQRGYFDYVLLRDSRAATNLVFGSDLVPWAKADQIRIARLLAKRMARSAN